jgi:polygalacturonase
MERAIYNVRALGAVADGKTPDTAAIQAAADACKKSGGGIIYIPEGEYLTSSIRLYSHTELRMSSGARLIADPTEAHYERARGEYDTLYPRDARALIGIEDNGALGVLEQLILSTKRGRTDCIIFAEDAENISITGGEINGNAEHFFTITESGRYKPHLFRPQMMFLKRCRGVSVQSTRLMNAAYYNIRAIECEQARFEGLTIETSLSYINSDGINIAACKGVTVSDCRIQTGDDCIAISNGEFTPLTRDCEDITVFSSIGRTNANFVRVFNGIEADLAVDIGIGGEAQLAAAKKHAVRNVRISNCTLEAGGCAVNMVGVFGKIEDVAFSDITQSRQKPQSLW